MKLLLAKRVPDVRLNPLVRAFDVEAGHGHYLTDTRRRLVLLKLIKDASVRQRCFSDPTVADEDELVIDLIGEHCLSAQTLVRWRSYWRIAVLRRRRRSIVLGTPAN